MRPGARPFSGNMSSNTLFDAAVVEEARLVGLAMRVDRRAREGSPRTFYDGRALVYVAIGSEHYTTDAAWPVYIRRRRERPTLVVICDTTCELRAKLFDRRIVV